MLTVYLVCLAAGGVVLGASAFAGHDSHEGPLDAHPEGDHSDPGHHDWALRFPFLSLRFWTWGLTFFGLTGVALTLGGTAASLVPLLAALTGVGTGWGASYVLGRLTRETVGALPEASSHIGREGRLLLPLEPGGRSKVRLSIGGVETDLLAETDAKGELPSGRKVLVVGMRGLTAVVEATPTDLPSEDSHEEET